MRLLRLVLLLVLAALSACAGKPQVEGTKGSQVNVLGEEESSGGVSVSIDDDDPEDRLARAGREQTDGDFEDAIRMYREIHADPANPPEVREEALYRLGAAHGHPLNAHRDYMKAVQRLEQFLLEFPESTRRGDAQAHLERYRALAEP